ncbi:MAG: hypothetical protein A2234_06970 [Elusimicrobia bacterium RIFOXYA2_FULL_58_8]|nr:MAG: hypothetical protein A2234_06970 [Elusimicrobia bacterium RIFOXYA2_FULL_58_8]OGS14318.1 MAG: hypothetical protein A2285_08630 [Elusimicrobia bacterium RIFOXYA12_FULL_57_11]
MTAMTKDFFPLKLLLNPYETCVEIAAGKTGWFWPLASFCASTTASTLLLCSLPPDFLAEVTGGMALVSGKNFWWHAAVGLSGALGFTLFFCSLLAAFLPFIKSGRLPLRLAFLVFATAAYGFFFLLPFKAAPVYTGAARLLAVMAAGFAVWTAAVNKHHYTRLVKAVMSLSLITLAADISGAAAALSGSVTAYNTIQYLFAVLALAYLAKAASAFFKTSTARTTAAIIPAMLASAAFLFSLSSLGLLSPDIFQVLLLI